MNMQIGRITYSPDYKSAPHFVENHPSSSPSLLGGEKESTPHPAWTAARLIAFEEEIAELFNIGEIRAPVHLYNGNEGVMINIFREVQPQDWVCCSWRSHYQCLLKGVPPDEVKAAIMRGRSIALCFAQYRIISSAIVGGILPIAVGLAMAAPKGVRVHCFLGDMTAETGMFHECQKYAENHNLPVRWIIEDNGLSTFTPTCSAWVLTRPAFADGFNPRVLRYRYQSKWPHSGAGQFVRF